MKATQILRSEHQRIQVMLRVLEILAQKARNGEAYDKTQAGRILEFLRLFADACHHGKEEDLLFPELEKAGVPRQGGPVGVMLDEHEVGRSYIRRMSEALAANNGKAFGDAADAYVELLTSHIRKEDDILFPMADRLLPAHAQDELSRCFARMEAKRLGLEIQESFNKFMDDVSVQYLGGVV